MHHIYAFYMYARATEWKVPTSFIYGKEDWMDYRGAEAACRKMTVPKDIVRIEKVVGMFICILCS